MIDAIDKVCTVLTVVLGLWCVVALLGLAP
jgi:hypothetical protein